MHVLYGSPGATVNRQLIAFEPTLIAHDSLVTTDMALAATMFAGVYALYRYCRRPTVARLLVTGVAAGLCLASKHTGVVILPILLILLVTEVLLEAAPEGAARPRARPWRLLAATLAYLAAVGLAVAVLWCTYGFNRYALPGADQKLLSIHALFDSKPPAAKSAQRLVELIDDANILPEAYTFGLAGVIKASHRPMYLLGTVYPSGRWFYFPVAFVIKSSLALLLLLPLALKPTRSGRKTPPSTCRGPWTERRRRHPPRAARARVSCRLFSVCAR